MAYLDRTPLATSGCSERNGSHSENAEHSGIAEHESEFVMHTSAATAADVDPACLASA